VSWLRPSCPRLIGRQRELDFLLKRLDEVSQGRGAVVIVGGEPGIGKSRLLVELDARAKMPGHCKIGTQCLEGARAPLAPVIDVLRELQAMDPAIVAAHNPLRRLLLMDEAVVGDPSAATASPANHRELYGVIAAVLRSFSRAQPLLITIEDLHWADLDTLAFFQFLTTRIRSSRILVIATFRTTQMIDGKFARSFGAITRAESVSTITLRPLGRQEMVDFIEETLAGSEALPARVRRRIRIRAEGSPLFAEELIVHAVGSGDDTLPLTLKSAVIERVSALPAVSVAILEQAAVIGRSFSMPLLAAITKRTTEALEICLREARDMMLVVEDRDRADTWSFRHALLREALYESLTRVEASRLHEQTARQLECSAETSTLFAELAYHWFSANSVGKAAAYSEKAGDSALLLGASMEAAEHYETAGSLSEASPITTLRLQTKLGRALGFSGLPGASRRALETALAAARRSADTLAIAHVSLMLSSQLASDVSSRLAVTCLQQALLDVAKNRVARASVLVGLALFQGILGDTSDAQQHLEESAKLLDKPEPSVRLIWLGAQATVMAFLGRADEMIDAYERAIEIARRGADPRSVVRASANLALMSASLGRLEAALPAADEAMRVVRDWAMSGDVPFALAMGAQVYLRSGNIDFATTLLNEAEVLASETDSKRLTYQLAMCAFTIAARVGNAELVQRYDIESIVADAFASEEPMWIGGVCAAVGEWYAYRGQQQQLSSLLDRACSVLRTVALVPEFATLVCLHGTEEQREDVHSTLTAWCNHEANKLALALLALNEALGRSGPSSTGRESALRAAAGFADCGLPYEEARSLEIAHELDRAIKTYQRAGSPVDAARVSAMLGVRDGQSVADQLSPRESEVVSFLKRGGSNRQIALKLGVSERTVESHLRSIYSKLGVKSRLELLARVLEPAPNEAVP